MQTWARAAILSATTTWLLGWIVMAVLIYGPYSFDLGRGGFSVQSFLGLTAVVAITSFFGAALGFHLGAGSGNMPGKILSPIVGATALALANAVLSVATFSPYNAIFFVGATFGTSSLVLAFIASKSVNLGKAMLSNKSPERTRD